MVLSGYKIFVLAGRIVVLYAGRQSYRFVYGIKFNVTMDAGK